MSVTISTLGDHAQHGHGLTLICDNHLCGRELTCTVADLIAIHGAEAVVHSTRWRVKCRVCGCRRVRMIGRLPKDAVAIKGIPSSWGMAPPSGSRGT